MPQPVLADGLRSWLVGESPVPVLHAWGLPPELARDLRATAVGSIPALPPGELVATRAPTVTDATERNREFVPGLAAQGPRLYEPKVMRIGPLAAEEPAGLSGQGVLQRRQN